MAVNREEKMDQLKRESIIAWGLERRFIIYRAYDETNDIPFTAVVSQKSCINRVRHHYVLLLPPFAIRLAS